MHLEPGVVTGGKLALAYAAAAGSVAIMASLCMHTVREDGGKAALALRSVATTILVLIFFEVFPHYSVGVSEVHFIFGATLYLVFGGGPAAIGLAVGLLIQGLLFAPNDLPQYFINVTTLIVPLWAVDKVAHRIIRPDTPYVSLAPTQVVSLAATYQGGVILLVVLWSLYGGGFGAANLAQVGAFSINYLVVILVEPIVAMLILAGAKTIDPMVKAPILHKRLHHPVT